MKRVSAIITTIILVLNIVLNTNSSINSVLAKENQNINITSTSAVLMEATTGQIIYEKNSKEKLRPASITKIMTLILIFEALESEKIHLEDEVSVSEHAASMGGSQVFLEPNEKQTVDTMIKCISVASGNDASVAMAEYIAGSEEEFVSRMNEKAKELGMDSTQFQNCTGLDTDNHYSSALDVAIMSRELIEKHPEIHKYSTIWMDTIIHSTKRGDSEFGLANTNKLLKQYDGITGLKTGSTSLAKYCLSATAERNGIKLISVIMAAPDYKVRFSEASKLLDYGYANVTLFKDDNKSLTIDPVPVIRGIENKVTCKVKGNFSYLCLSGENTADITKEVVLYENIKAPIKAGDKAGEIIYKLNQKPIGSVDIICENDVEEAKFIDYFIKIILKYGIGI